MTEKEIDDLAGRVAALDSEEIEAFEKAVVGIRAERAKRTEARIAELQAMSEDKVVTLMFMRHHDNWPNPDALILLREAGFVRGVTLEAAYHEGYERGAYDYPGNSDTELCGEDDHNYVTSRDRDLATLIALGPKS